ncbi:hypothetical protein EJ04DRAFT_577998 [Polyplosphaeria fusca]|uniref:Uncharacterized protein n=1 Tax=Polyplosphaeria fusca TaxID=682080 RepID=A0A9P4QXD5_9PLEO|nr:hypothetical protein EJ04DRAFT_577998 [Polyplosphaeria fusca]
MINRRASRRPQPSRRAPPPAEYSKSKSETLNAAQTRILQTLRPAAFPTVASHPALAEDGLAPTSCSIHTLLKDREHKERNYEKHQCSCDTFDKIYRGEALFKGDEDTAYQQIWYDELRKRPDVPEPEAQIEFEDLWPALRRAILFELQNLAGSQSIVLSAQTLLGLEEPDVHRYLRVDYDDPAEEYTESFEVPGSIVDPDEVVDPDAVPPAALVKAIQYLRQEHLPGCLLGEFQFPPAHLLRNNPAMGSQIPERRPQGLNAPQLNVVKGASGSYAPQENTTTPMVSQVIAHRPSISLGPVPKRNVGGSASSKPSNQATKEGLDRQEQQSDRGSIAAQRTTQSSQLQPHNRIGPRERVVDSSLAQAIKQEPSGVDKRERLPSAFLQPLLRHAGPLTANDIARPRSSCALEGDMQQSSASQPQLNSPRSGYQPVTSAQRLARPSPTSTATAPTPNIINPYGLAQSVPRILPQQPSPQQQGPIHFPTGNADPAPGSGDPPKEPKEDQLHHGQRARQDVSPRPPPTIANVISRSTPVQQMDPKAVAARHRAALFFEEATRRIAQPASSPTTAASSSEPPLTGNPSPRLVTVNSVNDIQKLMNQVGMKRKQNAGEQGEGSPPKKRKRTTGAGKAPKI